LIGEIEIADVARLVAGRPDQRCVARFESRRWRQSLGAPN
jgi:hypothetical protein